MKESGLSRIGVSVESANQNSLDLLGKGIKAAAIFPRLEIVRTLKLTWEVNLIFFAPHLTLAGVSKKPCPSCIPAPDGHALVFGFLSV